MLLKNTSEAFRLIQELDSVKREIDTLARLKRDHNRGHFLSIVIRAQGSISLSIDDETAHFPLEVIRKAETYCENRIKTIENMIKHL